MVVVQAHRPQSATGETVDMSAADALRENGRGDGDVALHDCGNPRFDLGGRYAGAGPNGAGYVGGAVEILATGIYEVHLIGADGAVAL
jgi:hypothetical protein